MRGNYVILRQEVDRNLGRIMDGVLGLCGILAGGTCEFRTSSEPVTSAKGGLAALSERTIAFSVTSGGLWRCDARSALGKADKGPRAE